MRTCTFAHTLSLMTAMACGYLIGNRLPLHNLDPTAVHLPPFQSFPTTNPAYSDTGPTIEQVRQLASLVVTKIDVADVSTAEIDGFTGGVRAALVVHGDVVIAVDLSNAKFESKDLDKKTAVLVLPAPRASRPRLDQEKTRLLELSRQGIWCVVPGDGGRSATVNFAYRHAQQIIEAAAADQKLLMQAQHNAEHTLKVFFDAVGWKITINWL